MSTDQTPKTNPPARRNTSKAIAFFTVAAIAVGGAFGVKAVADSKTYQHIQLAGSSHGGWHRGGHDGFSEMTEAEMAQRIARIVKHISIEIDATPEQEAKVIALVTAVASDMRPLRERMLATRKEVHDLLLADQIDRAALERIRTERLAEIDEISKNLVNAVADVAEVLTPEQRRVLEERIREFRGMFRDRGHRRHRRHDRG